MSNGPTPSIYMTYSASAKAQCGIPASYLRAMSRGGSHVRNRSHGSVLLSARVEFLEDATWNVKPHVGFVAMKTQFFIPPRRGGRPPIFNENGTQQREVTIEIFLSPRARNATCEPAAYGLHIWRCMHRQYPFITRGAAASLLRSRHQTAERRLDAIAAVRLAEGRDRFCMRFAHGFLASFLASRVRRRRLN